ncbi:MAG TPA: HD domain-containing protein [Syntrophomonadaceae bacterium]|nr:HD domain-containing protein [Syntrophomonadaceae bacterium]HQA07471.1 HD domain-containing protein [Syntrophomonadaceae bacterium]
MILPPYVIKIIDILSSHSREAFAVGGCVRDLLMEKPPTDYDVATSALPQEIMALFPKTVPTGVKHGTVTVFMDGVPVEISTFKGRDNGQGGLHEDLQRRDFTINAIAIDAKGVIHDPFGGREDLEKKIIRSPLNQSRERFAEDPLRMIRAIRLAVSFGFTLHPTVTESILDSHELIRQVSIERIREELNKILVSDSPALGIKLLLDHNLLAHIIPEAMPMVGFDQHNKNHDKDVFQHALAVLDAVPPRLNVRWAAFLHDIGKPATFTRGEDGVGHFYGHHMKGQEITRCILERLRYDHKTIEDITILVGAHMTRFARFRNANLKKLVSQVGEHNLQDLYDLQKADILGSAPPFDFTSLNEMQAEIEQILHEKHPLKIGDLAVNGHDLMEIGIEPGPDMGKILHALLEIVLEDPQKNNAPTLLSLAKELAKPS